MKWRKNTEGERAKDEVYLSFVLFHEADIGHGGLPAVGGLGDLNGNGLSGRQRHRLHFRIFMNSSVHLVKFSVKRMEGIQEREE